MTKKQEKKQKKVYQKPEIVHEIELETRAGSLPPKPPCLDVLNGGC